MDYKQTTLTKIKQEYENINEDVPEFVKIESGEVKHLPLNKFEFVGTVDDNLPNTIVKQEIDVDAVIKQEMDIDIKEDDFFENMIKTEGEDDEDNSMNLNGTVEERPFKSDKAFKKEEQLAYDMQKHTDSSDSCGSGYRSGSDSELASHPSEKHKINYLDEQTKLICLNVYKNLQLHNEVQNVPKESSDSIMRETAYLTEIPYSTICEIVLEDITRKNNCDRCHLRQKNV